MQQYKSFQSERLIIRPTLEQDAKLIYQLMNSPKFIKYVGDRQLYSVEDAEKYIQDKMLPQLHSLGYSNYSLINKKNGAKIGICGLYDREGLDGIDIGFGILPDIIILTLGLSAKIFSASSETEGAIMTSK